MDDTGCFVLGRPYGRRGLLSDFEERVGGGGSPKSSLGKTLHFLLAFILKETNLLTLK